MIRFYHGHHDYTPHRKRSLGFNPEQINAIAYFIPTNFLYKGIPRAKKEFARKTRQKSANRVLYRHAKIDPEHRVDVIMLRAGFIASRNMATHHTIALNGKLVPPYTIIKAGDVLTVASEAPIIAPIVYPEDHPLVETSFDVTPIFTTAKRASFVPIHRLVDKAARSVYYVFEPRYLPVRPEIQ